MSILGRVTKVDNESTSPPATRFNFVLSSHSIIKTKPSDRVTLLRPSVIRIRIIQTKSELFISCPHGGDCEYNTDEMGMHLYKRLLGDGILSTLWALHGYYSSGDKDVFHRWHVKNPITASDAYPGLADLVQNNRSFKYGIGFHIHKYDYVAVGGMASQQIRVPLSGLSAVKTVTSKTSPPAPMPSTSLSAANGPP